mmetsp:Transcript_17793/g.41086  ORF Transcript_17793/g.41086 Transcript_17793/m.41086 type:complete len:112 (-) Transcript_17793:821-1156(-)
MPLVKGSGVVEKGSKVAPEETGVKGGADAWRDVEVGAEKASEVVPSGEKGQRVKTKATKESSKKTPPPRSKKKAEVEEEGRQCRPRGLHIVGLRSNMHRCRPFGSRCCAED